MADSTINGLTALTGANVDNTADQFAIWDNSQSTTKKITRTEVLTGIPAGTASAPSISFSGDSNTGVYSPAPDVIALAVAGTDRIAIDSTNMVSIGNMLAGTSSGNGSWSTKLALSNDSGATVWAVGPYLGGVTNFIISAGGGTGVYLNGTSATSWTSASDERLKDIIEPIENAVQKVSSMRAVIGKFKSDTSNTRRAFLIAQDVHSVLPEAVDSTNPDQLGVAYTDVIPLLVSAIKELKNRIETIENA